MDEIRPHRSVKDLIESLLFLAEEPVTLKRMTESLPYSGEEIAAALDSLQAEYQSRGLRLRYINGGWEFTTDPALSGEIENFYDIRRKKRLSRAALETLAVIAYNQPLTRTEVESIRGVNTSGTLQTLQECNLIKVVGQKETLGNPYVYGTTDEFLGYFGLGSITELPKLEFEREGFAVPEFGKTDRDEGKADEEIVEAEVTTVDFGLVTDTQTIKTHVAEKGA